MAVIADHKIVIVRMRERIDRFKAVLFPAESGIKTAKACGLYPYLRYLFEKIPYAKNEDGLHTLLPCITMKFNCSSKYTDLFT